MLWSGIVGGAPVVAERDAADVGVVLRHEIRAAHIDSIGGGGVVAAVDADGGVIRGFHGSALIGAVVPLGDEKRRAFGGGQLRLAVLESDLGAPVMVSQSP